MASVSSLDKDLRKLRLDRYTPSAANEVRNWIEGVLGEKLSGGDLLEALKNGVALCKYVLSSIYLVEELILKKILRRLINLAIGPPGVKYKSSAMPFVQMENISHFLRACQSPPLNLQPHDVFLTVDLYEQKDPTQVLQCLSAFSRVANQIEPSRFPTAIGPKSRGILSPQGTGTPTVGGGSFGNTVTRGVSNTSSATSGSSTFNPINRITPTATGGSNGGRWSPTKSSTPRSPGGPGGVSSWSKKGDEGATSPAWNIAQYGYMGGASQGNMGISFGGRRQITSAGPHVPNLAEKEKRRREDQAEKERLEEEQRQAEEQSRLEREAEERRERIAEEERWAEETRKAREKQKLDAEAERRRWEDEEKQWRLEEERRQKEESDAAALLEQDTRRARGNSDARLRGQFLSQYQAEQGVSRDNSYNTDSSRGKSRIEELELELEKARERERQYERERQERHNARSHRNVEQHDMQTRNRERSKSRARSRSRPAQPRKDSDEAWRQDEREYLRKERAREQHDGPPPSPRPVHEPLRVKKNNTGQSARPLPNPADYASPKPAKQAQFAPPTPERPVVSEPPKFTSPTQNRTDRYLSSNPPPQPPRPKTTYSNELGGFDSAAERDAEDRRRAESQTKTKAGGWASKSLLEREMEMERQRQKEWEEGQKTTRQAARSGEGVDGIGGGIGGKWDVNQWTGYTGGDSQNKGTQGIGSGRRQIVGPRPPPSK